MTTRSPREIDDAFRAFRDTLQHALEDAARATVVAELQRMQNDGGTFVLEDVDFTLTIENLRISATSAPLAPVATRPGSGRVAQPGSRGSVRPAIVAAFSSAKELDTSQLKTTLASAGIRTTDANIHQQLRRLVEAGELERVARGRYRSRAAPRRR